jgi:hypothetical protein
MVENRGGGADGDEYISLPEFASLMAAPSSHDIKEDLRCTFRIFDAAVTAPSPPPICQSYTLLPRFRWESAWGGGATAVVLLPGSRWESSWGGGAAAVAWRGR